ncbi:MAG: methyl-accepting chemotaxis protein [Desulforegulaceae bacterium]|nr:methyl-accepting chemotaxis protein [Desulforegulaceae bacterium]
MKKKDSLRFKLMSGGILIVLIPLIILGYISMNKSSDAITEISKEQVKGIAEDLAGMTKNAVEGEIITAKIIADKNMVINALKLKDQNNTVELEKLLESLNSNFLSTLKNMGQNYEGIFLTDPNGVIFAGVMENGNLYGNINVSDRDYYKKSVSSGKVTMGSLIKSRVSDDIIGVISVPVKDASGKLIGTACLSVKVSYFSRLISERKIGKTGYGYMTNKKGLILSHPVEKNILNINLAELDGMKEFMKKMLSGNSGADQYIFHGVKKIAGYAPVGINEWYIATTQDQDEFLEAPKEIRNFILIIGLISGLIAVFLIFMASKTIVNPVNEAVKGLKEIVQGDGDLTQRLEVKTKDEIGELCVWFNTFMAKLQTMIKDISQGVNTISSSSTELSSISDQMSKGARDTSEKSGNVSAAVEEMTANMNSISAAMEQSSTNTDTVATAAEEMNSTINEIAQNAENARGISEKAVEKVKESTQRINQLGEAAKAIGKVVETITDISDQVNLLSLNATIEAARAGEAGKGFAVVANEIKELASQTSAASGDIKSKIENIQKSSSETMDGISEISNVINNVNDIVSTIATAVEEQSAATQEISSNINQASTGIQEVNVNVNQNSMVVQEIAKDISLVNTSAQDMASRSEEVKTSAVDLSNLAENLNNMVGRFKV